MLSKEFRGTSMERAGTAARNSPPSFTLSFFPFSAGPRPGCFWIQRAERRNQRSSVCVDDSLDNQLVSKLPDGRPAVEQNWKFSSSSLFDSVCRRCPSTSSVRPRARSRENSRSILEEYSDRSWYFAFLISSRDIIVNYSNSLFERFELVLNFWKCPDNYIKFVLPLPTRDKVSSKLL